MNLLKETMMDFCDFDKSADYILRINFKNYEAPMDEWYELYITEEGEDR